VDLAHLQRLFAGGEVVELGAYDEEFTATWQAIASEQRAFVSKARWWSRGDPGRGVTTPTKSIGASIAVLVVAPMIARLVVLVISETFWFVLASGSTAWCASAARGRWPSALPRRGRTR